MAIWYNQPWRLLYAALALSTFSVAQDSSSNSDSGDISGENATGASGASSSFVGSGSHTIIIVLSVVVGVVAILAISSAILFYVAKKRQWAIREKIRQSARRVAQSIKSPMTPRFPKSPKDAPLLNQQSQSSTMGEEKGGAETRTQQADSTKRTKMFMSKYNPQNKKSIKEEGWDLEQGIELGSTKMTTVRVSAQKSNDLAENDRPRTKKSWGSRFSFSHRLS